MCITINFVIRSYYLSIAATTTDEPEEQITRYFNGVHVQQRMVPCVYLVHFSYCISWYATYFIMLALFHNLSVTLTLECYGQAECLKCKIFSMGIDLVCVCVRKQYNVYTYIYFAKYLPRCINHQVGSR